MLDKILHLAFSLGFDDAKIAPWEQGSVLVLFSGYAPAAEADKDHIAVSSYYIAANRAYENAGKLAETLNAMGIWAKRDSTVPARKAALKTGGFMGKNGFYYHPRLGSLVHIQTILMNEKADLETLADSPVCIDCGKCAQACPAKAIGDGGVDFSRCLRNHMQGIVPDEMKPFVYQLFGCEKCQIACPMNRKEEKKDCFFDLNATIKGETLPELQALAGKNMARLVRTVNQSIIYAANTGNQSVLNAVQQLAGDDRFANACRYYLETQKNRD